MTAQALKREQLKLDEQLASLKMENEIDNTEMKAKLLEEQEEGSSLTL